MSEHIVVGSDRYITVPESLQKIGVQFDHNAETVTFDCPRYWDGHDLSMMKIYINYMRPNDSFGAYLCNDAEIDSMDDTIMHFNWVISGHVTEFAGPLSFLVCICDVDQNGDSTTHWNSELNTQMYISSGMKCRDAILGRYPDIITQLLNRMDSVEAVFAPTVEITEIEGGHHLKMIDVNGTYEFDVMDGNKGDKGDAFTYSDFTAEQLAALKGEKGDAFTYSDFTAEQLAALKGEKGDTGSGLRILGYYETLTALESSVTNPSVGDAYGIGSSEPYNIYIYTDINGWVNNGALQGAKGEDGHTPEKGIDYFTDADKQEIATAASEMIGQATDTKQGLVMVNGENGIGVNIEDGSLYIKSATEAEINDKTHSYNPIVPNNLNYAVKAGLTSNSITLTEAEKTSALNWIGAIPSSDKGKAGGVATLDSSGKVPSGQIPSLEYAGKNHASQHASGGSDPITPESIGAAPAGYGLGESTPTLISNCNIVGNGWYRVDASTANIPDVGLTSGVLRIDEATGSLVYQSLYFYVSGKVHKMERVHSSGTWYPWEWVNPPMDVDIEYRTTERHLSNPVYKKMDSDGVIWWSTDQSTWKREADRVGAASSTHASQHATGGSDPITPESIGAAPAGYGLGVNTARLITDGNDALVGGWFYWGNIDTNLPFTYGHLRVDPRLMGETSGRQTLMQTAYSDSYPGCVAQRKLADGVWKPWEWVNPPMAVGVEYRTTERHLGNPVYKKMDSDGVIWWSTDQSTWKREAERVGATPVLKAGKTIYVSTTGRDDTGNGSESSPYATIQKAIDSLPKNLGGNTVTINVASGTYNAVSGSPIISATKFYNGMLDIRGPSSSDKAVLNGNISLYECNATVRVIFLKAVGTDLWNDMQFQNGCIYIHNCQNAWINTCDIDGVDKSESGIFVGGQSNVGISNGDISNCDKAITTRSANSTRGLATVNVYQMTGANNNVFIHSEAAVVSDYYNNTVEAATKYSKLGGIIIKPDGTVEGSIEKPKLVSVSLKASGWNSSSKTQTVTVSGVLADETKQLITPTPALASQAAYYDAVILCTGQAANKLTFTAKKVPTSNLTVYVTIQEVGA